MITVHESYLAAVQAIVANNRHRFEIHPVKAIRRTCERLAETCPADHEHAPLIASAIVDLQKGENTVCADTVLVVMDGDEPGNRGVIVSRYTYEGEPVRFIAVADGIAGVKLYA